MLTSSGTTGEVSRIYLDKAAAATQTRQLGATVQTVLGPKRLPMLLVDTKAMLKDRRSFSARGAGVLGMATFGRDHVWALDDDGHVDLEAIRGFLAKHGGEPFLIFGFTYLVWLHLYEVARDNGLDLGNGILIHSGGWKKLVDQAVSPGGVPRPAGRRRTDPDAQLLRHGRADRHDLPGGARPVARCTARTSRTWWSATRRPGRSFRPANRVSSRW